MKVPEKENNNFLVMKLQNMKNETHKGL